MIEKRAHHEEAVSPVVGVMLMLVVTIVIAGASLQYLQVAVSVQPHQHL